MKKATKKTTKVDTKLPIKTIDQLSFARMIANKFNFTISDVLKIIEEEQKLTMEYVRMGHKVIKKNYLTIEARQVLGKTDWRCPLNGKTYTIEPRLRVLVRIGRGFKDYMGQHKLPEKICRFVSSSAV